MASILPDRFKKKPIGPPPGAEKKPGLMVAPDDQDEPDDAPDEAMPPKPKGMDALTPPAGGGDEDAGGKESAEDAIVLRDGEKTCQSCSNWTPEDGSCGKVYGEFGPGDRCLRFYQAEGGESGEEAAEGEGSPMGDIGMESEK